MHPKRPSVNVTDAIRHTTDQFARLRAAIAGNQHFVIATDHPRDCQVPKVLSRLAATFLLSGTDPAEVVFASTDFLLDSGHKFALTVLAFPKAGMPAQVLAGVVTRLAGYDEADEAGVLAKILGGLCEIAIASDTKFVADCLDSILNDAVTLHDSAMN